MSKTIFRINFTGCGTTEDYEDFTHFFLEREKAIKSGDGFFSFAIEVDNEGQEVNKIPLE